MVPTPTLRWISGASPRSYKTWSHGRASFCTLERCRLDQNLHANGGLLHSEQRLPQQVQWGAWRGRGLQSGTGGVGGAQLPGKGTNDGYMANETECPHALEAERSMRLGRALGANVMLH